MITKRTGEKLTTKKKIRKREKKGRERINNN
jgi:hypothetical protein